MPIVVRIGGEPVAPGQRERGRGRKGRVAAVAAAAFHVAAAAAVSAAGHQSLSVLLLEVFKDAVLHLDAAGAFREGDRGRAQLKRSRVHSRRSGGRRVHVATYTGQRKNRPREQPQSK